MRRWMVVALLWACKGDDDTSDRDGPGDDDDDVVGDDDDVVGDDDDDTEPPGELGYGRVCSTGGWCWETPEPAGGVNGGIWALSPDDVWVTDQTHLFHLGPDGIGHALAPTMGPYLNWEPVFGVASDDVWAHGFTSFIHWDGHVWSSLNTGTFASSIHGVASDDVWASGFSRILHWDGASWSVAHTDDAFTDSYVDVWELPSGDVVVGGMASGVGGKVWRFDGTTLTDLGFPSQPNTYVIAVYATSDTDVWAVAGDGAYHFDGSTWEVRQSTWGMADVWGAGPDDVWVLNQAQTQVAHWDGSHFTQESVPGAWLPYRMAGSGSEIWVTGSDGSIQHRGPTGTWDVAKETLSHQNVLDLMDDPSGAVWAVTWDTVLLGDGAGHWTSEPTPVQFGVYGLGDADGEVMLFSETGAWKRGGTDWQVTTGGAGLRDGCTLDDGTVLGVGDRLTRLVGDTWLTEGPTPSQDLGRVICHGDEAFATSVLSYDILEEPTDLFQYLDGRWRQVGLRSSLDQEMTASYAPVPDRAWVVFDGLPSAALAFDGVGWSEVPLGFDAKGVGGSGVDDVWIVGVGGVAHQTASGLAEIADAPFADFRWVSSDGAGGATLVTAAGSVWSYAPTAATHWREVVPAYSQPLEDALFAKGDLFAVDDDGYALGLVGTRWVPLPGDTPWVDRLEGNDEVGAWFQYSNRLFTWDGAAMSEVGTISGTLMVPTTGNRVLAYDYNGGISVLAGSTFTLESQSGLSDLAMLFGHSNDELWGVGTDPSSWVQSIVRRAGGTWSPYPELVQPVAFGTSSLGEELWIDATQSVWRRENGSFRQLFGPGALGEHYAVAGAHIHDTDDIWIASIGAVLHFDGDWDTLGDSLGLGFWGMTTTSDGRGWALGSAGWLASHDP